MIPVEHEFLSTAISQAWQIAALVLLVALAVRLFARNWPHLAHVLWLLVLVKCLTPPLWSSPAGIFSWAERALPASTVRVEPARFATELPTADVVVHLRQQNPAAVNDGNGATAAEADTVAPPSHDALASSQPQGSVVTFLMRLVATFLYVGWPMQIWICGTLVIGALSSVRWLHFWWRLRRGSITPSPELVVAFEGLTKKLQLRRPVVFLVTSSRIGPAVIGVLRPTVVLPAVVVEGRAIGELEPLLAHELLHVRRGDLWVGFLQVLAQGIWWWHPLVWLTGRMITREAERCCDEEVLAELGCSPAQYARGLLAVLELKRSLAAVPAFPGIRAVDVTSSRLERIMKLGQGCRRRTPWWCWGVVLLAAVVVLPGAALMGADDSTAPVATVPATVSETVPTAPPAEVQTAPQPSAAPAAIPTDPATAPVVDWTYDAKALVAEVKSNFGLDDAKAREMLMEYLYYLIVWNRNGTAWSEKNQDELSIELWQGRIIYRGDAEPDGQLKRITVRLSETDELSVRVMPRTLVDPRPVRNEYSRIQQVLRQLADYGLLTVKLEVRVASGAPADFDAAISDWEFMPVRYPKTDGESLPNPRLTRRALPPHDPLIEQPKEYSETISQGWFFDDDLAPEQIASTSVEEGIAARMKVLDDEQSAQLLASLQQEREAEVLAAPAITLFLGQTGSLLDTRESPFVVGLSPGRTPGDPVRRQIRVVTEGLRLHTRVKYIHPADPVPEVQLDLRVLLSHIQEVKTREVANLGTLQIPVVSRTTIESEFQLPLGKTLALGGLQQVDHEGKAESLILFLQLKAPDLEDFFRLRSSAIDRRTRTTQKPRVVRLLRESQRIELAMDSELIVEHEGRIAESELENPEVLSVVPLSDSRVQLVPRKFGSTHVAFFDAERKLYSLNVRVRDTESPDVGQTSGPAKSNEEESRQFAVTYSVDDLVVPKRHFGANATAESGSAQADFEPLVELIETTVEPASWDGVGGAGSIHPFPTNLSIDVTNTSEVHAQISSLLDQLRRFGTARVDLKLYTVRGGEQVYRRIGSEKPEIPGTYRVLSPVQVQQIFEANRQSDPLLSEEDFRIADDRYKVWHMLGYGARPAQDLHLNYSAGMRSNNVRLMVQRKIVAGDGIRSELEARLPFVGADVVLADGGALLIDLSAQDDDPAMGSRLVLITAQCEESPPTPMLLKKSEE